MNYPEKKVNAFVLALTFFACCAFVFNGGQVTAGEA